MPRCMKCGDIIGSGHVCRKCQEEFADEFVSKGRGKAYAITFVGLGALYYAYSRLVPEGLLSKTLSDALASRSALLPAITHTIDKIKEPTNMLDVQARLLFFGIILALFGSFALLHYGRK